MIRFWILVVVFSSSFQSVNYPELWPARQVNEIPQKTGSDLDKKQALSALNFHNKVRKDVGAPPLEWSADLAAYAQEWADYLATQNNCNIAHRSTVGKAGRKLGENIFWGTGKSYSALEAAKAWYSEIENYNSQPIRAGRDSKTGHYTQMVWQETRKVGIGIAKCGSGATIIVANYNPPGNVVGQKPY